MGNAQCCQAKKKQKIVIAPLPNPNVTQNLGEIPYETEANVSPNVVPVT